MTELSKEIHKLRSDGLSYKAIAKRLKCAKSTVTYHLSPGAKLKDQARQKRNPLTKVRKKIFSLNRTMSTRVRDFQRRIPGRGNSAYLLKKPSPSQFTAKQIIEKFGVTPECYLSGVTLDLFEPSGYTLDHIHPVTRGGENNIDNLGICHRIVNLMKMSMTKDELLDWCVKIITHNGYEVNKKLEEKPARAGTVC